MSGDIAAVKVVDICGPHCVATEDGERLFEEVSPALKEGVSVCLDFGRIETITSSFLNSSVGRLMGQLGAKLTEELLTWQGLDEGDDQLMRLVIRNAREHFSKSNEARDVESKIVRGVIEEQGDE